MPKVIDSFENAPDIPHETFVSTENVFDGTLLKLRVDTVTLPSGKKGTREMIEHPGSVVIVPVTTDGKVLFVRQFRYSIGDYLLELWNPLDEDSRFLKTPALYAARNYAVAYVRPTGALPLLRRRKRLAVPDSWFCHLTFTPATGAK